HLSGCRRGASRRTKLLPRRVGVVSMVLSSKDAPARRIIPGNRRAATRLEARQVNESPAAPPPSRRRLDHIRSRPLRRLSLIYGLLGLGPERPKHVAGAGPG